MMEKIAKYKKYIISIALMLPLSILFINIKYLLPKKYEPLPEVRLKEIESNKAFAIMVQNGDNYEEYKSNDNAWPGEGYKFKEAKCIDNNGELVENAITFESATKTAILETDKTISCTLYFDKSTLGKLRDNEKLANKNNLSSNKQGGMYRYQGTDNVDNWICFGTTDNCGLNDNLIDKYMYRIIGITPSGELYLLKETFLEEETSTKFSWNSRYITSDAESYTLLFCENKVCPEWKDSILFKRLNGISNGKTKGTGDYIDNANSDIFVDSSEYEYLKSGDSINGTKDNIGSKWYQLIADHDWMYGDIDGINTVELNDYIGNSIYKIETGQVDIKRYMGIEGNNVQENYRWDQIVNGKISLMYIHDYYYGYYDGVDENSRGNAGNYSNLKNSWIFFQKDGYNLTPPYEWLSTRWGLDSPSDVDVDAFSIYNDGNWGFYRRLYSQFGVRPVFYLKSDVKIKDGKGTKTNPYILDIK